MTSAPSVVRAVAFDLDGTLVDSMPLVLRAFAHALAPFRPDLDEQGIFQRLGGPPARMMRELIGDEANAVEALRRLEAFGFENGALVAPFTGMKAMLETLHARGLRLAIWTGRDRRGTEAILAAHGIAGLFAAVVCGDDLDTHKPHPGGLIEILARLGLRSDEMLYAGDADADVLGGAEAGVRTVLITHGREVDAALAARAWQLVDTPERAYALLGATGFKVQAPAP
jgi:HAD superfamily hydrolase (TIGR01549 family)